MFNPKNADTIIKLPGNHHYIVSQPCKSLKSYFFPVQSNIMNMASLITGSVFMFFK